MGEIPSEGKGKRTGIYLSGQAGKLLKTGSVSDGMVLIREKTDFTEQFPAGERLFIRNIIRKEIFFPFIMAF